MVREGSKAYGKALGDLRRSLQASSHRARMTVPIATIKLLAMFEAFSQQGGSEPKAEDAQQHWQRHYTGELALLIARTPVAHVDGELHDVFADERVDMVSCREAERWFDRNRGLVFIRGHIPIPSV
ncbi:hypothetical protein VTG60DRAFT_5957 [Thermothelomyces hinnuleus]